MKTFEIVCSKDGNSIDHIETVTAEEEPSFWECYSIAKSHGCEWFYVSEMEEV